MGFEIFDSDKSAANNNQQGNGHADHRSNEFVHNQTFTVQTAFAARFGAYLSICDTSRTAPLSAEVAIAP